MTGDLSSEFPRKTGELRYHHNCLHVWNGITWIELDSHAHFNEVDESVLPDIIRWATKRMEEEEELKELMEQYQVLKEAKHDLDIMIAILKDSNKGDES